MDDQTRQFGRPEEQPEPPRPRQHFPDPTEYTNEQYNEYDQPYRPGGAGYTDYGDYTDTDANRTQKKSGAGLMVMSILFVLALIAAATLFFMWRSANEKANQPPPAPVTVTQTETEITTEDAPLIPTDILPRDDQGNPQIPTEWPSDVPTTVPPEVSDGAQDAQEWLDGLIGELESALQ